MAEGKEASAWLDRENSCVYKFFDLRVDGSLGQKIEFVETGENNPSIEYRDATIFDTVDKLRILHAAGACPTEIVGLTYGGDYLVAKQPLCRDYRNLDDDRNTAAEMMMAVRPTGSYKAQIWVFWSDHRPWILGDLHKGNIRLLAKGLPTVIDALIGEIPAYLLRNDESLQRAVATARRWRETGKRHDHKLKACSDDDL